MTTSKEWWIDLSHSCQMGDCFVFDNKVESDKWLINPVHVIEHSAYEKLLENCDKLQKELTHERDHWKHQYSQLLEQTNGK